jgi:hypothetical protein
MANISGVGPQLPNGVDILYLTAGNVITVRSFQNSGSDISFSTDYGYASFVRIGV